MDNNTVRLPPVRIVHREEWGAFDQEGDIPLLKLPVKNVFFTYTETEQCSEGSKDHQTCPDVLRTLQNVAMWEHNLPDMPFNFLLGGDGLVYEIRGWKQAPEAIESEPDLNRLETLVVAYIGKKEDKLPKYRKKRLEKMEESLIDFAIENRYLEEEAEYFSGTGFDLSRVEIEESEETDEFEREFREGIPMINVNDLNDKDKGDDNNDEDEFDDEDDADEVDDADEEDDAYEEDGSYDEDGSDDGNEDDDDEGSDDGNDNVSAENSDNDIDKEGEGSVYEKDSDNEMIRERETGELKEKSEDDMDDTEDDDKGEELKECDNKVGNIDGYSGNEENDRGEVKESDLEKSDLDGNNDEENANNGEYEVSFKDNDNNFDVIEDQWKELQGEEDDEETDENV